MPKLFQNIKEQFSARLLTGLGCIFILSLAYIVINLIDLLVKWIVSFSWVKSAALWCAEDNKISYFLAGLIFLFILISFCKSAYNVVLDACKYAHSIQLIPKIKRLAEKVGEWVLMIITATVILYGLFKGCSDMHVYYEVYPERYEHRPHYGY